MTNYQIDSATRLKELDTFYKENLKQRLFKDYLNEKPCIRNLIARFEHMCDYNVPHGKKLRGLCAYESLVLLLDLDLNEANILIEQSKAIGWAIEFLQASFLVADDIMDKSTTRRGQPCWYLNENIGSMAINDAFYLISLVYKIINEFAITHPMYQKFYEVFTEALTNTVVGQGLDLITPSEALEGNKFNFSNYTEEQYYAIVKWKTAFYSFDLPIQCALYLASIDDADIHQKCKDILIDMGVFFQIQDDYLDCYGDPKLTGKVGTDIEESKCSWLIIQALKKANPEQRDQLENYYGKHDQKSVAIIKQLFADMNLRDEYCAFEQRKFEQIMSGINHLEFMNDKYTKSIKLILTLYASKIFKRNK